MPHKINVGLVALAALAATVLADPTVDRRASMGFMGMRGKKDRDQGGGGGGGGRADETSAAVDLDKRAMVFRRPMFDGGSRAAVYGAGPAEGYKRASMGFMGMRGKKDYYSNNKGSAAGFFGMRGKKVPSADAFYGVRGKKWLDHEDAVDEDGQLSPMYILYRIIDELKSELSDRERNLVAAKFDEEREMR
ncbi:tachykinins-like [Rhopalosiphum padi]|uniref:tachykinins-like n=1 Tax=Rhopalosiphum padi TaxID=40932 RepID=UPI00298E40E4|nr:tachykinins-like [Rhopalosiphum padi]XP_060842731.1 tachykinins-like [Rhopalosiphum padi]